MGPMSAQKLEFFGTVDADGDERVKEWLKQAPPSLHVKQVLLDGEEIDLLTLQTAADRRIAGETEGAA